MRPRSTPQPDTTRPTTRKPPFVPAGLACPDAGGGESGTRTAQLTRLGLHSMAAHCAVEADRAAKSETPDTASLTRLVELELADKTDRAVNARIARARFPTLRTLEAFAFSFQPGRPAARVRERANLAFLDQATHLLFVGGPGGGTTQLAIGLALKACAARRSVLFTEAPALLDQLVAAEVSRTLGQLLDQLRRLDLLVIDALGYRPMDGRRANRFFQLVAARYTRGSILVTSNVAFDGWGTRCGNDGIASASLDRRLHQSEIFAISGPSSRLQDKRSAGAARSAGPVTSEPPAGPRCRAPPPNLTPRPGTTAYR